VAHPKKKHKNKVAKPSPHRRNTGGRAGGTPPRSAEPAPPQPPLGSAGSGQSTGSDWPYPGLFGLDQSTADHPGTELAGVHCAVSDAELTAAIGEMVQAAASGATRRVLLGLTSALATRLQEEHGGYRRVDLAIGDRFGTDLALLWENGWQPLDVVHVAKRSLKARGGALAAAMVVDDGKRVDAAVRAPAAWNAQLAALAETDRQDGLILPPNTPALTRFAMELGGHSEDAWFDAATLLGLIGSLPKLPLLLPAPSRWDSVSRIATPVAGTTGTGGPPQGAAGVRMLEKVRALLAKAESTEFAAEAETFTAKAQDLMTRHSIDAAMVDGGHSGTDVHSRRVHLDDPYAEMKAQLVSVIAEVNRARAIWDPRFGMVVLVGEPFDLDLVELLFTSLLIQATRAMTEAGAAGPDHRSPGFRRAFLLSYATRIGERLEQAGSHAVEDAMQEYGSALVPVLAGRAAAVDEEFDRMFPNTSRGRSRQVDARGWHAGRSAADKAALGRPAGATGRKGLRR